MKHLLGELVAIGVHVLTGECQHVAIAVAVVVRDGAAVFDGRRRHPLIVDIHGHHVGRTGDGVFHGAGVTDLEAHAQVARRCRPRPVARRGPAPRSASDDGGQGMVVDLDQLRRIPGRLAGLGDHHRHRITDKTRARGNEPLSLGRGDR